MVAITNQLSPNPAKDSLVADGSEQTLASTTGVAAGGLFELSVDMSAMADGDVVEIGLFTNADTAHDRQIYRHSFAHGQGDTLKRFIPIAVEAGGRFKATLKQVAGTNRTFPWKVLQL